jgi:hypothetical protein
MLFNKSKDKTAITAILVRCYSINQRIRLQGGNKSKAITAIKLRNLSFRASKREEVSRKTDEYKPINSYKTDER